MNEIERKFLLNRKETMSYIRRLPSYTIKIVEIEQFYVQLKPSEIRYRKVTDANENKTYVRTEKEGFGLSRVEKEKTVSMEEFERMILGISTFVKKTRYIIGDLEFDFYPNGLAILEKEYDSEVEAFEDIIDFDFIEKEVTGDKSYSNATIASK